MDEKKFLAERFEANRRHLRAVAYRMLGSLNEAEDAVQEAWLRLSRSDRREVDNLGGWLTTVVARICLDMLRSRKSRREEALDREVEETLAETREGTDPEQEATLADSVGLALLIVLQTLSPAERVAFVLHDMFDLPFDEIAPIVDRTPEATRQLASRARRRVQGARPASDTDRSRQRGIVEAFIAASRDGDFDALLAVLDPDVVFRSDPAAARLAAASRFGAAAEMHGAAAVAGAFKGRARGAHAALVDGGPGFAVIVGGELRIVVRLTISGDRITGLDAIADPDHLARLDLEVLEE